MERADRIREVSQSLRRRAEVMCAQAIGKEYAVRTDKRTVVRGRITRCEVGRIAERGNTLEVVFKVWLNGGDTHFTVRRIP